MRVFPRESHDSMWAFTQSVAALEQAGILGHLRGWTCDSYLTYGNDFPFLT